MPQSFISQLMASTNAPKGEKHTSAAAASHSRAPSTMAPSTNAASPPLNGIFDTHGTTTSTARALSTTTDPLKIGTLNPLMQMPLVFTGTTTSTRTTTRTKSSSSTSTSSSDTSNLQELFDHIRPPPPTENKIINIREMKSSNGSASSPVRRRQDASAKLEGFLTARAQQTAVKAKPLEQPAKPTAKISPAVNPVAAMLAQRVQHQNPVKEASSDGAHPLAAMLKARQQSSQHQRPNPVKRASSDGAHPLTAMLKARQQSSNLPATDQAAEKEPEKEKEPALKEHPQYAKYFKMLKIGHPLAVVRHKMQSENINPSILDLDPDKPLSQQQTKPSPPNQADDEAYNALLQQYNEKCPKYRQMLKVGLPRPAVEHKMRVEGVDPAWLDGPPKRPAKQPAASAGPTEQEIAEHKQKYEKYLQMLKVGLPRGAVEHKMRMAGLDPAALDGPIVATKPSTNAVPTRVKRADSIRKKLHWEVKRHDSSEQRDSLWSCSFEDTMREISISKESKEELEKLFVKSVTETNKKRPLPHKDQKPGTAGATSGFQKKPLLTLIDIKKSQNIAITLARIKLSYADLKREILNMNPTVLSTGQLQSLMDMWPDQQEQVAIDNYHGEMDALGNAEKFLVETRNVPRFKEKLACLVFKMEFPTRVHELRESINLLIRGVNQVISSKALRQLFIYILHIGNLLNFGTDDDRAATVGGFSLSSLVKLSQTKAFVGGITFLQYVVQSIERDLPHLSRFHDEINLISRCSKVALNGLFGEKKALDAGLKSLIHESQAVSGPETDEDSLLASSILKHFANEVERELEAIQDLLDQMEQSKQKFLEYFEEEETSEQLDDLLGHISSFATEFHREHKKFVAKKKVEKTTKPTKDAKHHHGHHHHHHHKHQDPAHHHQEKHKHHHHHHHHHQESRHDNQTPSTAAAEGDQEQHAATTCA